MAGANPALTAWGEYEILVKGLKLWVQILHYPPIQCEYDEHCVG